MAIAWGLVWTAALIGLAGGVHCVAMCAAPCALAVPRGQTLAFQAGRLTGYAMLGALAALGAAAFAQAASLAPWMRPLWLMTHVGMLGVGGWMLVSGQPPRALQDGLLSLTRRLPGRPPAMAGGAAPLHRAPGPGLPASIDRASASPGAARQRAFRTGLVWSLLPCGLLYSALLLAWMAGSVASGMVIMTAFAVVSGVQLWLGQRGLLALLGTGRDKAAIRLAGAVTLVSTTLLLWWATTGNAPAGFCLPR